jgi:hypothetical protein
MKMLRSSLPLVPESVKTCAASSASSSGSPFAWLTPGFITMSAPASGWTMACAAASGSAQIAGAHRISRSPTASGTEASAAVQTAVVTARATQIGENRYGLEQAVKKAVRHPPDGRVDE